MDDSSRNGQLHQLWYTGVNEVLSVDFTDVFANSDFTQAHHLLEPVKLVPEGAQSDYDQPDNDARTIRGPARGGVEHIRGVIRFRGLLQACCGPLAVNSSHDLSSNYDLRVQSGGNTLKTKSLFRLGRNDVQNPARPQHLRIEATDIADNQLPLDIYFNVDNHVPRLNWSPPQVIYDHVRVNFMAWDSESGLLHIKWQLYDLSSGPPPGGKTISVPLKLGCLPGSQHCECTSPVNQNGSVAQRCFNRSYSIDHLLDDSFHLPQPLNGRILRFELTVTDAAGLSTTQSHNIQVDVSPPIAGAVEFSVHTDRDKRISAEYAPAGAAVVIYFRGFHDPDSGIALFRHKTDTKCHAGNTNEADWRTWEQTLNPTNGDDAGSALTMYLAWSEYVVTSVAYNVAGLPSEAVCSNTLKVEVYRHTCLAGGVTGPVPPLP